LALDLDDTLVDWPAAIDAATWRALAVVGLPRDVLAFRSLWEEIREYTWRVRAGRVMDRAHWRLMYEPQVPWERAFPDWTKSMRGAAVRAFREALQPGLFADALPALDALRGQKLAILSNNPAAKVAVQRLGLGGRFAAVVHPDDPFRKPHREAFAMTASALGVDLAGLAHCGDSLAMDVEGALAAGVGQVVWVDRWDRAGDASPGAERVTSLAGLAALLA
ncbi:MAG: HAD family hydrolase, partial [Dehalococcoidia bacterium]